MRLAHLLTIPTVIALTAPASVREYRIDAGHTDVAFSIGFLGHPVRGQFDDVRGTISYAANDPASSGITVIIGTKSISTGSAHRDEHLRSADFFDAAKYPFIVFRSASIARRGKSLVAVGPLTMHGVTRTVTIPFSETVAPIADPHGSNLVFFSGHVRIARRDFGILGGSRFNEWFDELRSAAMADSTDITLDVAGWEPDPLRTKAYDRDIERLRASGTDAFLAPLLAMAADSLRGELYDMEQLARVLQARGDHGRALAILGALSEKLDRDATLHSALSRAYEVAGRDSLARIQAARALALDTLDSRALELVRRLGARSGK